MVLPIGFVYFLPETGNYMLQQGLNVADVAYFIGEDTPKMTGITDLHYLKVSNLTILMTEVIERDLFVKDGC